MSDARHTAGAGSNNPHQSTALDWITRPVFGLLLAGATIAAAYAGGIWFALLIALAMAAAAREWHRMFVKAAFVPYMVVTTITVVLALAAASGAVPALRAFPWVVLMAGAIGNYALASMSRTEPAWQAFGVLYLGISAVTMMMLRMKAPEAFWLVMTLFAAVWATDTGALVFGNLIGGPKLVPVLSPNKTWAGFWGGIACAAITAAVIVLLLKGHPARGAIFGAAAALVAHGGDLFESWVKRRVGRKNSGSLIPGHGGVLDRIDSILLAAPICALAVLVFGLNPLLGVNP